MKKVAKSLLKYPGGKQNELKIIKENLPKTAINYYEPFVGGGSVFLEMSYKKYFINDISQDLIKLYQFIKRQNHDFFLELEKINFNLKLITSFVEKHKKSLIHFYYDWKKGIEISLSPLFNSIFVQLNLNNIAIFQEKLADSLMRKFKLISKLETKIDKKISEIDILKNIRSGIASSLYSFYRQIYNKIDYGSPSLRIAIFYYLRDFCYSSMFRYNKNGDFNVPYGGISYDQKNLDAKIEFLQQESLLKKLERTVIENVDFEKFFFENEPKVDDFVFLDPPYDTEFSTYDQNPFDQNDQIRLANFCKTTKAKFMLIIKKTDFILDLYKDFNIKYFKKNYTVSFKNRNKKNVDHLLITNY